MTIEDLVKYGTTILKNEESKSIGSSFFFKKDNSLYLVTAYHVIKNEISKKISIFLNSSFDRGIKKEIEIKENDDLFDEIEDIALIELDNTFLNNYEIKCFELKDIITDNNQVPFLCDTYIVGYPNGDRDVINNLPFIKKGIISTPYEYNFEAKNSFVIDITTSCGSSGSPTVLIENNQIKLIGILSKLLYEYQNTVTLSKDGSHTTKVTVRDVTFNEDILEFGEKEEITSESIGFLSICKKAFVIKNILEQI